MNSMGHRPGEEELHEILDSGIDQDQDLELGFADFVTLFACAQESNPAYHCLNRQITEFKEGFSMFRGPEHASIPLDQLVLNKVELKRGLERLFGPARVPVGCVDSIYSRIVTSAMEAAHASQVLSNSSIDANEAPVGVCFIDFATMMVYPHTDDEFEVHTQMKRQRRAYSVFARGQDGKVPMSSVQHLLGPEVVATYHNEIASLGEYEVKSPNATPLDKREAARKQGPPFKFGAFARLMTAPWKETTNPHMLSLTKYSRAPVMNPNPNPNPNWKELEEEGTLPVRMIMEARTYE